MTAPSTDQPVADPARRPSADPMGDKAWPLTVWSRERLFSVDAPPTPLGGTPA
jgi:hypothetical protein